MARTTFSGPVASENGFVTGTPSAPYVSSSSTAEGTATRAATFTVNPTGSFGSNTTTDPSSAQGSLYLRTDGTTTNDRIYVRGSSTWIAITTAS